MSDNRIAVIGAGITGLSAAFQLKKNGNQPDLFDRRGEPGGVIKTENNGEWRYEYGPNTILLKDAEVEGFISSLGLESEIDEANQEASKRFVARDGRLFSLPTSFPEFLKTPLFSGSAKFRLLGEPFQSRTESNTSISDFFAHRFGKEVLEYAVNPFIAGIHAGRPDELSLRHCFPVLHELEHEYGSVMIGGVRKMIRNKKNKKVRRRLISFKEGLQQLPKKIFAELDQTYLSHDVKRVKKTDDVFTLDTQMGEFGPYNKVLFTLPLHKWNRKLLPLDERQLDIVSKVEYPPLSVLVLGYKTDQVEHPLDGFGFLVPEKEERSILGALIPSTLFKGRAPAAHHLLTVFAGGGRQPEIAELCSEDLLRLVEKDLTELIGLSGTAVYKDHIYWPNSIPQYHTEYDRVLDVFEELEENNPGLHIAGNYRGGISVPDCIKNGIALANELSL